jgi:hypothetical protein
MFKTKINEYNKKQKKDLCIDKSTMLHYYDLKERKRKKTKKQKSNIDHTKTDKAIE